MEKKNLDAILDAVKSAGVRTATALKSLLAESEEKALASAGSLTARGRIEELFDAGTFMESGTFVRRADCEDAFEGVICGWGSVGGRLVFAFSQDYSRAKGALTEAHAEKIVEIYRLAIENGAPVIGIFDSAGALLPEGAKAMAGYSKIMKSVSMASGVIPQIAIVPGVCSGSAAVIAGMFDFIIVSEEKGRLSFNAPFAIDCANAGDASFAAESGLASLSAKNDSDCIKKAKELLFFLPMNNMEGTVLDVCRDDINRPSDISAYENSGDSSLLAKAIADNGVYLELNKEYAKEMTVGFLSVNGTVCGLVANRKCEKNGILSASAARKASRVITFCDAFNIPVITLIDSEGPDVTAEAEASPYAAELAKLAYAYTTAKCPLVTVIVGEAYGAVFSVMGTKAMGADVVLALESAKVGAMSAERAVAFLWNDQISDTVTRDELEARWNETQGSPVAAASYGEIDDIIASDELRQRVAGAVMMLSAKSKCAPARRHANMPL